MKKGEKCPDYIKLRVSLAKKGRPSTFKGKKHSEQSRRKMRENRTNVSGKKHPMYGARLEKNHNWKGGCQKSYANYARFVWEEYWGDKLMDRQIVHHIDGNIKNNDITNLASMTFSQHMRLHYYKREIDEKGRLV